MGQNPRFVEELEYAGIVDPSLLGVLILPDHLTARGLPADAEAYLQRKCPVLLHGLCAGIHVLCQPDLMDIETLYVAKKARRSALPPPHPGNDRGGAGFLRSAGLH